MFYRNISDSFLRFLRHSHFFVIQGFNYMSSNNIKITLYYINILLLKLKSRKYSHDCLTQ